MLTVEHVHKGPATWCHAFLMKPYLFQREIEREISLHSPLDSTQQDSPATEYDIRLLPGEPAEPDPDSDP